MPQFAASYEEAEDNEITFHAGEPIVEIEAASDDWWQGKNVHGKVGLFPGASHGSHWSYQLPYSPHLTSQLCRDTRVKLDVHSWSEKTCILNEMHELNWNLISTLQRPLYADNLVNTVINGNGQRTSHRP